MVKHKRMWRNW